MAASISKTLTKNINFIALLPPSYSTTTSLPRFFTTSSAFSSIDEPLQHPSQQSHYQGKERGIWSKMFLFLPGAITFGLGTWQIFRRNDKASVCLKCHDTCLNPILILSIKTLKHPFVVHTITRRVIQKLPTYVKQRLDILESKSRILKEAMSKAKHIENLTNRAKDQGNEALLEGIFLVDVST